MLNLIELLTSLVIRTSSLKAILNTAKVAGHSMFEKLPLHVCTNGQLLMLPSGTWHFQVVLLVHFHLITMQLIRGGSGIPAGTV